MDAKIKKNDDSSAVDVTDEGKAVQKHWYVARVQARCEKKVAELLTARGYEVFVPIQREIRQWSDRKKVIDRIVLPLFVFVYTESINIPLIRRFPLIYEFLKAPGSAVPATIPAEQIESFKIMLQSREKVCFDSLPIKNGDRVVINKGDLQGLSGIVDRISKDLTKICIVIDYIGCASVIVPSDCIEKC